MWERFNDKAKRVILLAQDEATRLGQSFVTVEHLLLGIIREKQNLACKTLEILGIDFNYLRQELRAFFPKRIEQNIKEKQFHHTTKTILEYAFEEARSLGVGYIGTEHLLLGILHEGNTIAAQVLINQGVTYDKVRRQLLAISGEPVPAATARPKVRTPLLNQFSRELTMLARENKLDPVVGREKEIERVIQIISKRTKNNPVLVGEPGVGKTAIVEGLAQKIVRGDIPALLRNKRIVDLDLSLLVAGTKYRGEFEERLKRIMDEILKSRGEVIVFVDEIHTLIGAGAAEGALDASNILKPSLARGEMQCIGATTADEYRKYLEKDQALERRFQPVFVNEPTIEETILILKGLRPKYESHHNVKILDESLNLSAQLSARYISDRYLPDKAIDVIDEAASRVHLRSNKLPPHLENLEMQLATIIKEKEEAIYSQNYKQADVLFMQEKQLRNELEQSELEWQENIPAEQSLVTEEDIAYVVSSWTGIPLAKIAGEESVRLLQMEDELHKRVIGQHEPIVAVAKAIRRSRAGLKDPKRPAGSFIFLGPTGVGKTELARALAEFLFGDENALVRLDMSEYMERFAVSRLVGAPPGYVGYEEGGQLTEAVRRKPYCVVLFDEIEKAHPDVFNILLQIMDEGQITDSLGHKVDFKNAIIIMTSNLGTSFIKEDKIGIRSQKEEELLADTRYYEKMKNKVIEEVKKTFKPEFLNRIDEIIVFHSLAIEHIKQIVDLMLNKVRKQLKEKEMSLEVSDEAKTFLAKKGFDPNLGARPLRRCIQKMVEDVLSEKVLKNEFSLGDIIFVELEDEELVFNKKIPALVREQKSNKKVKDLI